MKKLLLLLCVVGACEADPKPFGLEDIGTGGASVVSTDGAVVGAGGAAVSTGGATTSSGGAAASTGGATASSGGAAASTGGAPGPTNLVDNGDFSNGEVKWLITSVPASQPLDHAVKDGVLCATLRSGQYGQFVWPADNIPDTFRMFVGKTYVFSYRIKSSGQVTLQTNLGHQGSPYVPKHLFVDVVEGVDWQTIVHEVAVLSGDYDSAAGVDFFPKGVGDTMSEICIDDVAVTEKAAP